MRREEVSRTLHLHVLPHGMSRQTVTAFRDLPAGVLTNYDDFQLWERIGSESMNCWLGDASWVYTYTHRNSHCAEGYVPPSLRRIFGVMGERIQKLDKTLQEQILDAFDLRNDTGYRTARVIDVSRFLVRFFGRQVFLVRW